MTHRQPCSNRSQRAEKLSLKDREKEARYQMMWLHPLDHLSPNAEYMYGTQRSIPLDSEKGSQLDAVFRVYDVFRT